MSGAWMEWAGGLELAGGGGMAEKVWVLSKPSA
jgi:hypothetical protein